MNNTLKDLTMISIVILTKNEEIDLAKCLQSVQWSNDIHVLDSGSFDKTIEIAMQWRANVATNLFESFGKQRNFALDNLKIKNEWILFLDADEVVTDKFRIAMVQELKLIDEKIAGFYCCWKMMFEDRWLKHSDNFPKWQFRLLRMGRARFTDFGHGQKETAVLGKIKYIKEPYLHYGFSKGWSQWIERHNRYSTLEATERLYNRIPFKNIYSQNESIRNAALKYWLSKNACWPFLRFFYTYVLMCGFLEAGPGLIYCINMGYYEFLIQIKTREIRKKIKEIDEKMINGFKH